jgi:HPt (histidine-containing phosphotransfer) domain-containing protein
VPGFPGQTKSANLPLWDQAEALRQLSGDQALLVRMIDLFLIEGLKQLGAISDALAAANWHNLALAAHTLKGSLSYFGTEVSVACASAVEQAARSEQAEVLEDLTNTLLSVVSDFMGQLRQARDAKK